MKVRVMRFVEEDIEIEWQTECSAKGRRSLENKRGKKLICKSCGKEITEDRMMIAKIKDKGNIIVHIKCADKLENKGDNYE